MSHEARDDVRYIVVTRGPSGFGVVCSSKNVITGLKGRAASDSALRIGSTVVSVDGEDLSEGERLIDRIRSSPDRDTFTLGTFTEAPAPPPMSINQIMKGMMTSPAFKSMASKMVANMVVGNGGQAPLLEGARVQQQLSGPNNHEGVRSQLVPSTPHGLELQAQEQRAAASALIEQQVSQMLESDQFSAMMDKVIDSPAIQKVVEQAEAGTLCPDADGVHAVTACLIDGGVLKSVTDATCTAMGVTAAECAEVRLQKGL